jgi:hypothetical protein
MLAVCPVCQTLREITATGERIGHGSAQWWRVVMHADGKGGICVGSGRRV